MKLIQFIFCGVLVFGAFGCGGEKIGTGSIIGMDSGDVFSPKSYSASVGDRVTWINRDIDTHTVTFDTNSAGPNSPDLTTGGEYSWVVPNVPSGTKIFYHCKFHGSAGDGSAFGQGMVGVVTVK